MLIGYFLVRKRILSQQLSSSDDRQLQEALQPRQLFVENDDNVEEDLTSVSTNDDEVFVRDSFQTPPSM